MHELSLAKALIERIEAHLPAGAKLNRARVRAGAMAAVEPEAMQLAWTAVTQDTPLSGATLELEIEPYKLRCPECGRNWLSDELFVACDCGCARPQSLSDAAMVLVSMDVEDNPLPSGEGGPKGRERVRPMTARAVNPRPLTPALSPRERGFKKEVSP